MKTERRTLEDWEVAECLALKTELADYNKRAPKGKKLTQEEIADKLGMSQGTLSSHLNGKRAINLAMASKMAKMLDIDVARFSPRLANEIVEFSSSKTLHGQAAINYRVTDNHPGGVDEIIRNVAEKAVERAYELAMQERFVGPRRAKVLINAEVQESIAGLVAEIISAADSGQITDEQINAIRALIWRRKPGSSDVD
ncbi:helix-turn-helix domain-containing protein [Pseudomonas juntendi]|uniref:helix-turn-helix domain-containing protein n=1 Tax=Pseudomonas TaxID=286 RepID=UPI0018E698C2|nr:MULTISPECIES: helix-turn-helix transcriptional regulator [Pseudomonas]MBI6912473.1 helix-turn-helix transcriptional regulator [Pseudomonas juntendi]MDG9807188.1 helix-turn-helix domain-containing protein [Pseudomonas juntendi]